jgi:hypothetical protein
LPSSLPLLGTLHEGLLLDWLVLVDPEVPPVERRAVDPDEPEDEERFDENEPEDEDPEDDLD